MKRVFSFAKLKPENAGTEEKQMMKKKITAVFAVLILLWVFAVLTDFNMVVRNFEKPFFCVLINGADDGGSGKYLGLGYSFEIEGNFMPEDEYPGVTKFDAKLFGFPAASRIRD